VQSILFATSLNANSAKAASIVLQWTERVHGHLTLLHVPSVDDRTDTQPSKSQPTPSQSEICADRLRDLVPVEAFKKGQVDAQLRWGRPSQEILTAAKAANADLIIVGAAHTPLFGRLAPEGTLHRILSEARCPVVSFHHERAKHASA